MEAVRDETGGERWALHDFISQRHGDVFCTLTLAHREEKKRLERERVVCPDSPQALLSVEREGASKRHRKAVSLE